MIQQARTASDLCKQLREKLPAPVSSKPLCRGESSVPPPDEATCFKLWDQFAMQDHIREHSLGVALVAEFLACTAKDRGLQVDPATVRASALLHDLAKPYTIAHGGNHAQIGGAWVMQLTGNPLIAQGVYHHIYWPWPIEPAVCFLPLAVLYADKRVRHDNIVTLEERYEDLFTRYGKTRDIVERIKLSKAQLLCLEETLSRELEVDLNACTFADRRLV